MMKKFPLSLCIVVLAASACKKESVEQPCGTQYSESFDTDTVVTSPYIMAWPGSSWTYDDGTTHTCDNWEQVGIIETSSYNGCKAVHTTHTTVASTSFGYIHGQNLVVPKPADAATTIETLLAISPGECCEYLEYIYQPNSGQITTTNNVVETLDSMEVAGVIYHDVIHVHQLKQTLYYHVYSGPNTFYDRYYARDVGLIRIETGGTFQTTVVRNLVSYVIGPH